MRSAKNTWFTNKADEAEQSRFGRKEVWKCIRDMQYGRCGLVQSRLSTIVDECNNPCTTLEDQQQRWRRHFTKILTVQSQFNVEEIDKARQTPLRNHMAGVPSMEELTEAVIKLKNEKVGGATGILPEMVKAACCEADFLERLLELIEATWKEGEVPRDWSDTLLVPVLKKGNLSKYDNWK